MAKRTWRNRWLIGFLIVLAVGVAAYFAVPAVLEWVEGRGEPQSAEPLVPQPAAPLAETQPAPAVIPAAIGTRIGERAPDFTLPSLDGTSVSLSQFRGSIVILDFWASWCSPCRATMPAVHDLWRGVADRGVVLIGVSLDRTADAAATYLRENSFGDMVALWGSLAAAQAVAEQYRVVGIPHTFVIDRAGIVRFNNHPARLDRTDLDPLL